MLAYLTDPIEPAVTLAEVKAHLHIDDDTETDMLQQYMSAATQEAEHHLCREIIRRNDDKAVCDSIEDVPSAIKQVILARVASFYSQREDMGERQLSTYYRNLLDPWILYNREDEVSIHVPLAEHDNGFVDIFGYVVVSIHVPLAEHDALFRAIA